MNYVDLILIILLISGAISGAIKGFIVEFASLVALIAGVWGAIRFSGALEIYLVKSMGITHHSVNIIVFVVILLVIVVAIHFLAKWIQKLIESTPLSTANRIFGLFFGAFKTAFFLGVLVILVDQLDKEFSVVPEKDIKESKLYSPLNSIALTGFPFLKGLYSDWKGKKEDNEKNAEKPEATI